MRDAQIRFGCNPRFPEFFVLGLLGQEIRSIILNVKAFELGREGRPGSPGQLERRFCKRSLPSAMLGSRWTKAAMNRPPEKYLCFQSGPDIVTAVKLSRTGRFVVPLQKTR